MHLLVSVANAAEASAALAGGADFVDAKDPRTGALGAVSEAVLRQIRAAVGDARPVTAAIGDATNEADLERTACAFAAAGAVFVKVGFAGITNTSRIAALTVAARRGALGGSGGRTGVVIVAYADAHLTAISATVSDTCLTPVRHLVDVAARTGARGVLLDTADKSGPGLRTLVAPRALAAWVTHAHDAGLLVALAGKLTADDLPYVCDAGADIAGVRGAACEDGRTGCVSAERVRQLRAICASARADSTRAVRPRQSTSIAAHRSDRP